MALNSMEKEWSGFAEMVIPDIPKNATQHAEMKKAFFAGAWAMFAATEEIGEPHVSEKLGLAYLEARKSEMLSFKNRIMAEYAEGN